MIRIEVDLLNRGEKSEKMNGMYRFCSAPEVVAALESITSKLSQMDSEMRQLITSVRSDVKVSVLLETVEPILAVSEEIIPRTDGLKQKQRLLADARKAFGSHVLTSRMYRFLTHSTESVYCLIMGKMFFNGMAVEVDYEKSASFFQCAISYGNIKAFAYLGRQYERGLGMIRDDIKAVELYMNGGIQKDSDCLYEMGQIFQRGAMPRRISRRGSVLHKAAGGSSYALNLVAKLYRSGFGVKENKRKALETCKRALDAGDWDSNLYLREMYHFGEGEAVNMKKAMHHYIHVKYEKSATHWNLACIYECEEGFMNDNRALYHFRLAADLGHLEARGVVGEYFLSVTGPRKLRFTNGELQVSLRKIKSQYSRRKKNTPDAFALPSIDCALTEFSNPRNGLFETQLAIAQDPPSAIDCNPSIAAPSTVAELCSPVDFHTELVANSLVPEGCGLPPSKTSSPARQIINTPGTPADIDDVGTHYAALKLSQKFNVPAESPTAPASEPCLWTAETPHIKETPTATDAPTTEEDEFDDADANAVELKQLRQIKLNKSTVSALSTKKLAAVLAAYLLGYEERIGHEFFKMEKCLSKFFKENLIRGAVLVYAEEEDMQKIMDKMIGAICATSSEEMRISVKVLLSSFINSIRNDVDSVP